MSSGKNETADEIDVDLATCGASYCPAQVFGNLEWDNGTAKNETEGGNDKVVNYLTLKFLKMSLLAWRI